MFCSIRLTCSQELVTGEAGFLSFPLPTLHLQRPSGPTGEQPAEVIVFLRNMLVSAHLSLIGKTIGADDPFVELDRGLRVPWFILTAEVHKEQAEPLAVSFIPLKAVQERPGCVGLHVHTVSNC